jgi:excisionase family DNA binding protein
MTMTDYRQIAGEIAGAGHDDLIHAVATRLHANDPPHLHIDADQPEPCAYCWLRAGRAVRVMVTVGAVADSYLKPGLVAVRLGVSNRTVYRMIESGELAALRLGRTYQVSAASAFAMIDAHLARPPVPGGVHA